MFISTDRAAPPSTVTLITFFGGLNHFDVVALFAPVIAATSFPQQQGVYGGA